MGVTVRPYRTEDETGVVALLKRSYAGLAQKTDSEVSTWGTPIFSPTWGEQVDARIFPYKYGAVILNNDEVVGYLGCISAIRHIQENSYISTSGTTWAIDDGYRIYMFKAMKLVFEDADLIIDLTPIPSVEAALRDIMKFNIISSVMYRYYPMPRFFGKTNISVVNDERYIYDPVVRQEYNDHKIYSVICLAISTGMENSYLFFSVRNRYIKGIIPISIARVLKTTNKYYDWLTWKDIVWFIQQKYALIVECDAHFLEIIPPEVPYITRIETKRYVKQNCEYDINIDYLYTEYAVLPV